MVEWTWTDLIRGKRQWNVSKAVIQKMIYCVLDAISKYLEVYGPKKIKHIDIEHPVYTVKENSTKMKKENLKNATF